MKKIGQCLREKSTHRFRTKSFSLNDKKGEKHSFIYFTKPFYLLRIYMYHSSTFILSLSLFFSLSLSVSLASVSQESCVAYTICLNELECQIDDSNETQIYFLLSYHKSNCFY